MVGVERLRLADLKDYRQIARVDHAEHTNWPQRPTAIRSWRHHLDRSSSCRGRRFRTPSNRNGAADKACSRLQFVSDDRRLLARLRRSTTSLSHG